MKFVNLILLTLIPTTLGMEVIVGVYDNPPLVSKRERTMRGFT